MTDPKRGSVHREAEVDLTRSEHRLIAGQDHATLENVLELAYISRPAVGSEFSERSLVQALYRSFAAQPLHEMVDQRRQILHVLGERWSADEEDCEPVVEIGTEVAVVGMLCERLVSCGHNPDIDFDGFVVTDALQLSTLDKAEELGLQRQRHLADLVKEQRAAVCSFDSANSALNGPSECAPGVSEELGLKKGLRNRGTIDGDKRLPAPGRKAMDGLGDDLLA